MKKKLITLLFFCATVACHAQTLFTVGNTAVSKGEFLRAYNKNKPSTANKQQLMEEYLKLYINFKLKVKAAASLRFDTLPQINYDLKNFKEQVLENYLNDAPGLNDLVNEAAIRATKDVRVAYFYIPVEPNAIPADTLKAYTAATYLYNALKKQGSNPADLASECTQKYTLTKYADAGYVTVFTLPYILESEVYNTAIGAISKPIKTPKGWFIIMPIAQRVAMGNWTVAQLLFALPPAADLNTKQLIKAKADSIYTLLTNGLAFEDAAAKYSDDRTSASQGGLLQPFGTGAYSPAFEKNVITLPTDGSISKPFETSFGYHIVKRLQHKKIPTDTNDNELLFSIKQQVTTDERMQKVKDKFLASITTLTKYKKIAIVNNESYFAAADSLVKSATGEKNKTVQIFAKKNILQFDNSNFVKGIEWINFLKLSTQLEGITKQGYVKLLQDFCGQSIINYYKNNIEKYNPEFESQMEEFKEGNMLFEIMEQQVWSRALQDSINLLKYYEANSQKYIWGKSADVIIFHAINVATANAAVADLQNGQSWKELVLKSNNQLQADSGRYELVQLPGLIDTNNIRQQTTSTISINESEGDASFVYFIKLYEPNEPRNFKDAKGLVISDYQNILEKNWLAELIKKYPVKINEVLFKQMMK